MEGHAVDWEISWLIQPSGLHSPDQSFIANACFWEDASRIAIENQSLEESMSLTGVPFYLQYSSNGMLARSTTNPVLGQIGGWSLDLLHVYDIQNNVLYLGNGERRGSEVLGAVPQTSNGERLIATEDAGEVYIFDFVGRHLRTVDSLTGTPLYQFTYDGAGQIVSVADGDGNTTLIERDAHGTPTAIVGPFGHRTMLTVDSGDYLTSIVNPAGESVRFGYDPTGLLTTLTDARGNVKHFTYDSRGRLSKDTDAAGGAISLQRFESDPNRKSFIVTLKDALGRTATYNVDQDAAGERRVNTFPDGLQTEIIQQANGTSPIRYADGTKTSLVRSPDPRWNLQAPVAGDLAVSMPSGLAGSVSRTRAVSFADQNNLLSPVKSTETVRLNGRTTTLVYDAAGKRFTETSAGLRKSTWDIDNSGRVTRAEFGSLLPFTNIYNGRGQLISASQGIGADTRTVSFGYSQQGYLQTITDPLGRRIGYAYDVAGRVTQKTLPDGHAIQSAYDENGNLISITPPGKSAHTFNYTPIDRTSVYTPPNVGVSANATLYTYDLDGALTKITRPDGRLLIFAYDAAGTLSSVNLGVPPSAQILDAFAYDPRSGTLRTIDSSDGVRLDYTHNGALLTAIAWTGPVAGSIGVTYDTDFRVTSLTVNGANDIDFSYDADGLLTQAGSLTLAYDAGRLLSGTTLGMLTSSYNYSGFGELIRSEFSSDTAAFFTDQYSRDSLGRITQKVETIAGSTTIYGYGYDLAGRLIQITQDGVVTATYGYDANGNRLHGPDLTTVLTYDGQDRLLTYGSAKYTYTAGGELATKTSADFVSSYTYDVLGSLKSVILPGGITIDYVVDGRNRRVGKKVNGTLIQGFLYQGQSQPVAELDASGNIVSRFIYASRANVPDYMIKSGGTFRIISDYVGSPRIVVDAATGNIVQKIEYDAFGQITTDTNPGFQPFGFAGGLYDRETKLTRFGARDYDAESGRWTTKDPIGFHGGDVNLYQYAANDPINFTDPLGFDIWIEGPSYGENLFHQSINVGDPLGEYRSWTFGVWIGLDALFWGITYPDVSKGGAIIAYMKTTAQQDIIAQLRLSEEARSHPQSFYGPTNNCRTYSRAWFNFFKERFHGTLSTPPSKPYRIFPPRKGPDDLVGSVESWFWPPLPKLRH